MSKQFLVFGGIFIMMCIVFAEPEKRETHLTNPDLRGFFALARNRRAEGDCGDTNDQCTFDQDRCCTGLYCKSSSGVKCGSSGRQCVSGMRCVNKKCACPEGESGNAEFECVKTKERVCFLTSDSRVYVEGFGRSGAPVNIPCSYRASRFITRKSGAHSYCGIEVHVTNERWGDSYRTRAVHVSVGVTEPILQIQSNMETMN